MKTEKKNRILSKENTICNRLQNGKHKLCTNQKRSNYAKCRLSEKNDFIVAFAKKGSYILIARYEIVYMFSKCGICERVLFVAFTAFAG